MLELQALSLRLETVSIVNELNLKLNPGEIGCLLGPSGCGKTTTLRLIAGFVKPSQGSIYLNHNLVSKAQGNKLTRFVASELRELGMLFQDFALFPHLSVYDNIAFGLRHLKLNERQKRIKRYLQLIQLDTLSHRKPWELSGGQQQRVALARALAPHPKLLLMDEPFSSLDTDLRRTLAAEVETIIHQEGISALMVTHDQHEAMQLADTIGVMRQGSIEQWDTPYNVYHEPNNRFIAHFIGHGHFVTGRVTDNCSYDTELGHIDGFACQDWAENELVDILIRPDDLVLVDSGIPALITKKSFQGAYSHYWLKLTSGAPLEALFPSHFDYEPGQWIQLGIVAEHLVIFPHRPI